VTRSGRQAAYLVAFTMALAVSWSGAVLLAESAGAYQATRGSTAPPPDSQITREGMAGLTIGMSLDQARRNLKGVLFERTSDGDGAALVTVQFATGPSIVIFAGEDDPDTAIDWSRPIQMIETFDAYFVTADGVRVGSLVADLIPRLGAVREIVKSEIESREYITFERHPARLTLRIDYTGEFGASNHTTRYKPTARIYSIAVSAG
jgi:hypothetical protein